MCSCVFILVSMCDSNLVVRRGKPEHVVAELIKQLGSVSAVAFQKEVVLNSHAVISDNINNHNFKITTRLSRVYVQGNIRRAECGKKVEECL